eukprot:TRINITY_DN6690_c0_g3_i1.p1 TRINITY_DN6690_c0_g3~~TRINITY_DN6690_c0_g3_i1.p1  ORF type:complete len:506 (+),score=64.78 TRINITY_DN6690_c0_g3_i1:42-1559(+)
MATATPVEAPGLNAHSVNTSDAGSSYAVLAQANSVGGLEQRLLQRVLGASLASAAFVGLGAFLVSFILTGGVPVRSIICAVAALSLAHLLRAASVLQRSVGLRRPSPRGAAVSLAAIVMSAIAAGALAYGFGASETSSVFGLLLGSASLLCLADRGALEWSPVPREAAHRRFKSAFLTVATCSARWAVACVLAATFIDGAREWSVRFVVSMLLLLATEFQAESLQSCTSLGISDVPSGVELAKALAQPLAMSGAGLGRWLAMSHLAQAVTHRQHGMLPGVRAGAPAGISSACAGITQSAFSALAAEVFSRSCVAVNTIPSTLLGNHWTGGLQASRDAAVGAASEQKSLFATYLSSGLEVMREFTVRVECLSAAARHQGPDALYPSQLAVLDAQVVELAPLARVVVIGLPAWIALSRDLDEMGVVQRTGALQKIIPELCGMLCATDGVLPLRGALQISNGCDAALQSLGEESRHSLEQLLLAFEDSGLKELVLPAAHERLIRSLCQ